jgi:predicted transcriptional regulator of viral defense system
MRYAKLSSIERLYFGYEEIARVLGIGLKSAAVSANRYTRQGMLIRLRRNLYILASRWKGIGREEQFELAGLIQAPSYVSLTTALAYYDITTQVQQEFVESIALKRTKKADVKGTIFNYSKIDKQLYFGFRRERSFFIASPEKALLDAVYLMSLKRYNLDISAIDTGKMNMAQLRSMAKKFPAKILPLAERIWTP